MPQAHGGFAPISGDSVPSGCRDVFGEAAKDRCFRDAAVARIRAHPMRWLGQIPAKLSQTFDYTGAAGWYLHAANPDVFSSTFKFVLGALETLVTRLSLVLGLFWLVGLNGSRRLIRVVGALGILSALTPWAFPAVLVWLFLLGRVWRRLLGMPGLLCAFSVVAVTATVHSAFFGAGRYSLVCLPFFVLVAVQILAPKHQGFDTQDKTG